MYDEDDLLPLSALQHIVYCERRCALVHLEGQWSNNAITSAGLLVHSNVDEAAPRTESRGDRRITRGLPLRSFRLGLSGKADAVEFRAGSKEATLAGNMEIYPIEYKSGRLRHERCYEVQVCAQAICLEEMLGQEVFRGGLFYGKSQRRVEIEFDSELRREVEDAARRLHALVQRGVTPQAEFGPKCKFCSLAQACLPKARERGRVGAYVHRMVRAVSALDGEQGAPGP